MKKPVTRLDDWQYLLASQINYTLTNFADHGEQCSHDAINRSLSSERITPRLVWVNVRDHVVLTPRGSVLFEDTVLDKHYAFAIALVRSQYSGNAKAVIKGSGVVTYVDVNPNTDQCWLIDSRIYEPAGDGQSQRDHVRERLTHMGYQKPRPLHTVLMETWDATKDLLLCIASLDKRSYCPRKANRHVDDTSGTRA